jgi:hypothetical protein
MPCLTAFHKISLLILLFGLPDLAYAQRQRRPFVERRSSVVGERVQEYRKAFISQSIALDKKDSVAFWTIYLNHDSKIRDIRRRQMKIYQGTMAKSDEEVKLEIQKYLALQEEELQATRKLTEDLQKVITARQIVALFKAEKEVKKELLKKITLGENEVWD